MSRCVLISLPTSLVTHFFRELTSGRPHKKVSINDAADHDENEDSNKNGDRGHVTWFPTALVRGCYGLGLLHLSDDREDLLAE